MTTSPSARPSWSLASLTKQADGTRGSNNNTHRFFLPPPSRKDSTNNIYLHSLILLQLVSLILSLKKLTSTPSDVVRFVNVAVSLDDSVQVGCLSVLVLRTPKSADRF